MSQTVFCGSNRAAGAAEVELASLTQMTEYQVFEMKQ